MAKRKEETRHWKRCRDGKLAHEKNATACATGETHVTTTARYRHAPVTAAKIKNGDDARLWRGRGRGCGRGRGRGGAASCTSRGTATRENRGTVSHRAKCTLAVYPGKDSRALTQKWRLMSTRKPVRSCSQQLYSSWPKAGNHAGPFEEAVTAAP